MATHNQRGRGFLCIETDDDQDVDLEKIIWILKESMSAGIYEFLKRGDEGAVVLAAHKNPRFVEDCVREMAKKVLAEFEYLPEIRLSPSNRRMRRASTSTMPMPNGRQPLPNWSMS